MPKSLLVLSTLSATAKGGISPASFLKGYLEPLGILVDEYIVPMSDPYSPADLGGPLPELIEQFDVVGLSAWGDEPDNLFDMFWELTEIGKTTVLGGPGAILDGTEEYFTHTVLGPGEYFLEWLLTATDTEAIPTVWEENRLPPLKFKLTDCLKGLLKAHDPTVVLDGKTTFTIRTFDGCYWARCFFCTYYDTNFPTRVEALTEKQARLIAETMKEAGKQITEASGLGAFALTSHSAINRKQMNILLSAIEAVKPGITWGTFMRPEQWVGKFMDRIAATDGRMQVGFELIDYDDVVNKGIGWESQVVFALKARKAGAVTLGCFLHSAPGSNTKSLIESAANLARIRHCLGSVIMQPVRTQEGSFYEEHPNLFNIELDEEQYSLFRNRSGGEPHEVWLVENRKYLECCSELVRTPIHKEWKQTIFRISDNFLEPLGRSEALRILRKHFGTRFYTEYMSDCIDRAWSLTEDSVVKDRAKIRPEWKAVYGNKKRAIRRLGCCK